MIEKNYGFIFQLRKNLQIILHIQNFFHVLFLFSRKKLKTKSNVLKGTIAKPTTNYSRAPHSDLTPP